MAFATPKRPLTKAMTLQRTRVLRRQRLGGMNYYHREAA
jgi:hypothetical protein